MASLWHHWSSPVCTSPIVRTAHKIHECHGRGGSVPPLGTGQIHLCKSYEAVDELSRRVCMASDHGFTRYQWLKPLKEVEPSFLSEV